MKSLSRLRRYLFTAFRWLNSSLSLFPTFIWFYVGFVFWLNCSKHYSVFIDRRKFFSKRTSVFISWSSFPFFYEFETKIKSKRTETRCKWLIVSGMWWFGSIPIVNRIRKIYSTIATYPVAQIHFRFSTEPPWYMYEPHQDAYNEFLSKFKKLFLFFDAIISVCFRSSVTTKIWGNKN